MELKARRQPVTRLHGFDSCRSFRWDAKTNGRLDEASDPTQSIYLESSKFDCLSAHGHRRCVLERCCLHSCNSGTFQTWRGGFLMLMSWGASTLSSQLVRKHPRHTAAYGMAMTSTALFGLAFASALTAAPLFVLYGSGLGIAMTAISISRSHEVEDTARTREMNKLNVLWAAGACLTPALALRSLHTVRATTTFAVIGCLFAVTACSMVLLRYRSTGITAEPLAMALNRRVPLNYCLFAFLAVGIESCVGGWLTTYVRRAGNVAGVAAPPLYSLSGLVFC